MSSNPEVFTVIWSSSGKSRGYFFVLYCNALRIADLTLAASSGQTGSLWSSDLYCLITVNDEGERLV